MKLRSHLVVLVLAALVPVLGFAALVIRENGELQRAATERGMRETAHAVAATVDQTLETTITTLEALAESDHLDAQHFEPFHALARRVAKAQGWVNLLLFAPDGQILMHSNERFGRPLGRSRQPEVMARARDERRPVVSDLFDGDRNRHIVAVYVPIIRDGAVRFVLAATLSARQFSDVLRNQQFSPGSVAVLQDRANVIVARTQGEAEFVGRRISATPSPGNEGWARSRLSEGPEVYVAFATAPQSGWRVAHTVPVETVDGPLRRALWQLLAGAAVAAALAGVLTFAFGRRIAGAVGAVVRIARALERGDPAQPLHTGVEEVNVLADQLRAAAETVRAREHDTAMREHQARTLGQLAHALNASPDLDAILHTAVEAARVLVRADAARIALVDDAGRLVLRYSTGQTTAMPPGFVIERGHGLGGLVLAMGRPIRSEDFAADPRFRDDKYLPIARADGVVSCMAAPIVSGGAVVGVIYANNRTSRPFTDAEETLLVSLADHAAVAVQKARLLAGEHAARAAAEAASRGKDELLAMLGHELRNPLSAIANAVHILERAPDSPAARRALDIVGRQSAHLAHLVDDLLDVARITSGRIALTRRPMELSELVRRTMTTLAASGRTADHLVTVDVTPVWVDADETRIEQVVTNLVGNAVKFTPAGGAIDVTVRTEDGHAVLRVRDSGSGIDPAMLPRVFDIFVQGDRDVHGGPGGLGLGLTLVRRIAELHGGRVEAESRGRGHGSVFTVRIPAIPAPAAAAAAPTGARDAKPSRRVLIVEDNADAREMLRQALALAGHEVHEAPDGEAALVSIGRARPDVAVVDVGLPGIDGYELVRQIRAEHAGKAIRLIALTGYGQPDDRRRALEAGFDAHLVKPVDFDALDDTIRAPRVEP